MDGALTGQWTAVARLLTVIENGGDGARAVTARLHPHPGAAAILGVTGAPGSGKSTLTERLIARVLSQGQRVAVLAVDPSSARSGGAILGDRIRMQAHAADPGVFIGSMASRGHRGGLALAVPGAVRIVDAAGVAWVIVETVGVGQDETDMAGLADTTVVVVTPGWGDAVQFAKAGLVEIADLFVVNKADRDGAAATVRDLESLARLAPNSGWRPPVIPTVAARDAGIGELWDAIGGHRAYLETSGLLEQRRARRLREELRRIVAERIAEQADELCRATRFEEMASAVVAGHIDPFGAAASLLGGPEGALSRPRPVPDEAQQRQRSQLQQNGGDHHGTC